MSKTAEAAGTVDCDIHNEVPSVAALLPYLDDHWREVVRVSGFKGPIDTAYPLSAATSLRPALRAAGVRVAGLAEVRRDALDGAGSAVGILNCAYAVDSVKNPDAAAAVARAVNDWQVAEWLNPEPRLRASVVVPSNEPDAAAREIDRAAEHPGFVQVVLPVRSAAPYGNRRYLPIFEAAARRGLVVGIHFGGAPGNPPTPVGFPGGYVEEWAGMASVFQSQLMSLISEGVFDRFPDLKVVMIEGGWTWVPSLMWRFDKDWKGIRREVPWVRRAPSEYIRERVRFTLQPLDAPPDRRDLDRLVDQLGSDAMLLYSTDYPHWQFDGDDALPPGLSPALRRRIMVENPRAVYRLG